MAVAIVNPRLIRFVVWNFVITHISVGVHIGHTAVANFYSSPVKKLMHFVMRRKMFV